MNSKKSLVSSNSSGLQHNLIFALFILLLVGVGYSVKSYPTLAAWFGFFVAGYSAIANDSIQTIGTFIASNKQRPWWQLWVYLSLIFMATVSYSWVMYNGDVSHQRLIAKGFENAPESFNFLQVSAPIVLLVLTKARMPVSTTLLLLSAFAGSSKAISKVLFKSLSGYFVAFICGFIIFFTVARVCKKHFKGTPSIQWVLAQWVASGLLWSVWLQQDLANIAVFLPRSLSGGEFALFSGFIILGMALLLFFKGGGIQVIVTQKSFVTDPRFVTIIDAVYALILYYFKIRSKMPMSTTWVFLGLLAGREFAMSARGASNKSFFTVSKITVSDASKALLGLGISIYLATAINARIDIRSILQFFMA